MNANKIASNENLINIKLTYYKIFPSNTTAW